MVSPSRNHTRTAGRNRCGAVPHRAAACTSPAGQPCCPALHCRHRDVVPGSIKQEQDSGPGCTDGSAGEHGRRHLRHALAVRTDTRSREDPSRRYNTAQTVRSHHATAREHRCGRATSRARNPPEPSGAGPSWHGTYPTWIGCSRNNYTGKDADSNRTRIRASTRPIRTTPLVQGEHDE